MPEIITNLVQVHPFRMRGGRVEYLLLRRADDEPVYPGIWQVITGGIEPGESSLNAARRELLEETGLAAERWLPLPTLATFYFAPADQMILSPVFACELMESAEPVLSAEHTEYCWLAVNEAHNRLEFPTHRSGVQEVEAHINVMRASGR